VNSRFKYRDDLSYPGVKSETAEDGSRVYYTPFGPAPSVTTILSTLPTDIGNCMHNMLEAYVRDVPYDPVLTDEEEIAKKMFRVVRTLGLRCLDEVWGIEVGLYCENLYAGRTDLVGVFKGKPSIIDYKTAKYFKRSDWIEDYKHQIAAYAIAHEEMFPNVPIEQGVILIGTRPNPAYKVPPKVQRVILDSKELTEYKMGWLDIIDEYQQAA
jgi:hypothetical protein